MVYCTKFEQVEKINVHIYPFLAVRNSEVIVLYRRVKNIKNVQNFRL
jgi:hypothetical protein